MKSILNPLLMAAAIGSAGAAPAAEQAPVVRYDTIQAGGVDVFYREAGPKDAPAVLLLHGFGASSHMFRDLIPQLATGYHVVAPDLPGFGLTNTGKSFRYTFDNLADVIDAFAAAKGLQRYAIYVFDYGAPVGWRLAVRHPEQITAIVSQNGNAYEEGLSPGWAPMRAAWADPTPANREALRKFNTLDMLKWQYVEGVKDTSRVAPDGYLLAHEAIARIGVDPQMDLLVDYGTNIKQYAQLHEFFRRHQPPTLAIWGKNDPFFLPPGAEAFQRDNPKAEVRFLDTGHFAIETHGAEIARAMRDFLDRHLGGRR
ncbi:alpha/beta fold hydrolase [Massilia timonae]|uniref:Alpha/beta hydrolase family protein n=1 Tax=Massilia timonae TaxID=47229 RepID=A0A1S2NGW6_9BURK|nr:alpha/beta hydrolase [Massilia timonae]OIJ44331.1 alpha/beta hydrolase family protein [Massilia timonae]